MSKIAYLNSTFLKFKDAKVHIEDRGLQFSDSVYEVIPFFKKKLVDFEFHLKRLKYSLQQGDLKKPFSVQIIKFVKQQDI